MSLRDKLRVPPGSRLDLTATDPLGTPGLKRPKGDAKIWSRAQVADLGIDLATMQEQLFATAKSGDGRARVLLVLQAMDCGGKDGTIRRVAGTMNPQGLSIVGFNKPTEEELAHDFLWRIRRALPAPGQIGVFNRSHYEDVLIVRVHNLVPRRTWQARYAKINKFEAELAADGVTIVKVMLHISQEEQRRRLLERLDDPTKYWKYNPADVDERGKWDEYRAAYEDALSRCSTEAAPWYVVPADRKWYRDWAVANVLLAHLDELKLAYPEVKLDLPGLRQRLADPGEHQVNNG
jgi:PPK2 family polyphosphate:nucleotide phosphotransferase